MQYFSFFLLSLSLLATGNVAVADSPKNSAAENKYEPEFVAKYNQECIQTSLGEGLDTVAAEKLCSCTINEFQKQYAQEEFVQLTAASNTDETAANTLIEVGQICFEQTLYE